MFLEIEESIISNDELTFPSYKPRAYAYASDTSYHEDIIPIINKADILYHETTFCEDKKEHAEITKHSTAKQAATIAKKANVGLLVTGHYSSRYKELECFAEEAKTIFPNTKLGLEGKTYTVERKRYDDL